MRYATRLATAGLCLAASATLAGDRFAVKPGLWEVTTTHQSSGMPAIPDEVLAKLPPEQRARIMAPSSGTHTHQQCVTEQDLERPFRPEDAQKHCTDKVVSQTSTAIEIALDCKEVGPGGGTGHGTFKVHATSAESAEGVLDMAISSGGQPMNMHSAFKSHWLGANCGDVKPARQQH